MTNVVQFNITGVPGIDDRKWSFTRPTTIEWSDMNCTIRPALGQAIRIRESIQFLFERSAFRGGSMIWDNRFYREAFIGHFQVERLSPADSTADSITERGQIIGDQQDDETFFNWTFQREYSLNFHLLKSDSSPASLSAVENCNADLAPGAVENRNIQAATANNYAQLAYGLATGNLVNFNELLTKLASPVINGFKFPDKILFKSSNQIPNITLEGLTTATRLGDIKLWVHPDWMLVPNAQYFYQVIDFAVLPNSTDQYPFVDACTYPGGDLSFP
jgi:hypothetical protein